MPDRGRKARRIVAISSRCGEITEDAEVDSLFRNYADGEWPELHSASLFFQVEAPRLEQIVITLLAAVHFPILVHCI